VQVSAKIRNRGINNEYNVSVNLTVSGTTISNKTIPYMHNRTSVDVNFAWVPTQEADYIVGIEVAPIPDENITTNNMQNQTVRVFVPLGEIKIAILDSWGTDYAEKAVWDKITEKWYGYGRYIISVDYTTLNKEDITYSDLVNSGADVIVLSDAWDGYYGYGWEYTDSEIVAITQYVQEGHGIMGTAGTLCSYAPNNMKLAPLFGLDESAVGNWAEYFSGEFDLLYPSDSLFTNIPDPYTVGYSVTVTGLQLNSSEPATIMALSNEGLAMITKYKGTQTGTGASVYLTHIPEYAVMANEYDKQIVYNSFVWAKLTQSSMSMTLWFIIFNHQHRWR